MLLHSEPLLARFRDTSHQSQHITLVSLYYFHTYVISTQQISPISSTTSQMVGANKPLHTQRRLMDSQSFRTC